MSKCGICKLTVYHMDSKLNLDGTIYHSTCAKCGECGTQLTVHNGNKTDDNLYCTIHFGTKFAKDGGYISPEKLLAASRRISDTASGVETKSPKCGACGENVYPMDPQVKFEGSAPYHSKCAKCSECGTQLTLSNFAKTETAIFCQLHYDVLYRNQRGFGAKTDSKYEPSNSAPVEAPKGMQCGTCSKIVYPMEPQMRLDGTPYHNTCAKCSECNTQITYTNFCKDGVTLFCKTHYIRKFQQAGGYAGDEKFKKRGGAFQKTASSTMISANSSVSANASADQGEEQPSQEEEQPAEESSAVDDAAPETASTAQVDVVVIETAADIGVQKSLSSTSNIDVDSPAYEVDEARPNPRIVPDKTMHAASLDALDPAADVIKGVGSITLDEASEKTKLVRMDSDEPNLLKSFTYQVSEDDPSAATKANKKVFMM